MTYPLTHILSPQLPQNDIIAFAPEQTRAQFNANVFALSHRLQQAQARFVALWFDDSAQFATAILAAWHAGADVLLLPNLAVDNISWAAEQVQIWLTDDTKAIANATQHLSGSLNIWCINDAVSMLPESAFRQPENWQINPERRALLKTSGSSGTAQIVAKTAEQMECEAMALAEVLPFAQQRAVSLGSVSVQHLYGFTFRFAVSLTLGWILSRTQNVYPETLLADTAKHERVVWISSPALLNRLGEARAWDKVSTRIAGIISAGGALPEQTAILLQQHAVLPCEIYGSTETGVMAHRMGSGLWQPLPSVACGLNDEGALWVQSAWSPRWQTADAVEFSGSGFQLLGRLDRIIKLEDKRVSLHQIEHELLAHPFIADAYCALHPERHRVSAWLALNDEGIESLRSQGRAALIGELKKHLAATQDVVAQPRYWRFATELPRNAQAKIAIADFQAAFTEPNTTPLWQSVPSENTSHHHAEFIARVPVDLHWLAGHFAHFPLVPGVIELNWARQLAKQFEWGRQSIVQIENLKYQQFVRPNDEIRIILDYDAGKNKMTFKIIKGSATCASGRIVFG